MLFFAIDVEWLPSWCVYTSLHNYEAHYHYKHLFRLLVSHMYVHAVLVANHNEFILWACVQHARRHQWRYNQTEHAFSRRCINQCELLIHHWYALHTEHQKGHFRRVPSSSSFICRIVLWSKMDMIHYQYTRRAIHICSISSQTSASRASSSSNQEYATLSPSCTRILNWICRGIDVLQPHGKWLADKDECPQSWCSFDYQVPKLGVFGHLYIMIKFHEKKSKRKTFCDTILTTVFE